MQLPWKQPANQARPERDTEHCVLCAKTRQQVKNKKLISGLRGSICTECIDLCSAILHPEEQPEAQHGSLGT